MLRHRWSCDLILVKLCILADPFTTSKSVSFSSPATPPDPVQMVGIAIARGALLLLSLVLITTSILLTYKMIRLRILEATRIGVLEHSNNLPISDDEGCL